MRTGLLSDEYIYKQNPAFFPDVPVNSKRKGVRTVKKSVIPFYDLFAVAQVTMQNPYDLVDEYAQAIELPNLFEPAPVMAPRTPEQKSRVSSSNFWVGSGSNSSDGVQLFGMEEETTEPSADSPSKKTINALKKLRTDMIGQTVGGAPNVFTQSSPFKIFRPATAREDELAEAREDLEATTERPPSVRNNRGVAPGEAEVEAEAPGEFFLLPLYKFFSE